MSDKIENPNAFPVVHTDIEGYNDTQFGMTLRDYFAGQAINGILSHPVNKSEVTKEQLTESAYRIADAMLKERSKK